ncbi:uncharacterized protein rbbp8l isoform X2 [Vanacampus margaritifer]
MESFNELLLKLREVHERELEAWQMKVQELSNKKGCDTKRMEELFTKNQQMKEQHRLLTENIKTLENRLRAGLCDRCTVTQEVAKRRQHEFEVSQMQTIQHITLLVGETNSLKKENRRLRDEIDHLREALNHTPLEAKPNTSPDLSPSSGPVSLIAMATGRATSDQPLDGNVEVKTDTNQMADEPQSEHRQLQAINKSHFALSTFTSPSWKTQSSVTHSERRSHMVETLDQSPPVSSQGLLLRTSSSSLNADVNPTRHTIKAPVPCRPQPIKSSPVPFPWALPESSAWATVAASAANLARHPYPKSNLPRFPNVVPTGQHTGFSSNQDVVYGAQWQKHSNFQSPMKEPTVVFRLKNLAEHAGILGKSQEKKDMEPSSTESVSGDGLRDVRDGPLDLSDRGKSIPSQSTKHQLSLFSQEGEGVNKRTDKEKMQSLPIHGREVSPPVSQSLPLPSLPQVTQQEEITQQKHKVVKENAEQKKEANGKIEQSNGKKVPALTISLRPVVLESLNSALRMQDSLSTNGKSALPAVEPGSSEEQVEEKEEEEEEEGEKGEENVSEQETNHSYKRKKLYVDTEVEQDSDTNGMAKAKKVKIPVRAPEKTSS